MLKLGVLASGAWLSTALTVSEYCTDLLAACPGKHSMNSTTCNAVMAAVTVGNVDDVETDTLECRYKFLVNATYNSSATKCQYAGPTGGGRCGKMVDTACNIAVSACMGETTATYTNVAECKGNISAAGKAHQWGWKQGAAAFGEDSLECRAYHATAWLQTGDNSHCGHMAATGTPAGVCDGKITPDATHFCETQMYWCTGSNKQYTGGMPECLKAVASYNNSDADARDTAKNTFGCREYHTQAGAVDPSHCEHGGPSGGGACGSYAEGWASLAKGICNDTDVEFVVKSLGSNLASVIPNYQPSPSPVAYSTTLDVSHNTIACRLYHLTVATTAPPADGHCLHGGVTGAGVCGTQPLSEFLCDEIGAICGFDSTGASTYQFKDKATCNATLGGKNVGSFADRTTDTLGCRSYHVAVAASFKAGQTGADTTKFQQHCNHVLAANTQAGGCAAAAATSAPTPKPGTNSAVSTSAVAAFVVAAATAFAL